MIDKQELLEDFIFVLAATTTIILGLKLMGLTG